MNHDKSQERRRLFDFDVLATLGLRLWSLLAGSITVIAVPLWLSRIEQGYYFTFASILALQVFFELGLNYVLVQFVGAQMAKLSWNEEGHLTGDETALSRLQSLVSTIVKVFAGLACLYFCLVGVGGALFFASSGTVPPPHWQLSWWLVTACTAGNLFVSPLLAISEGAGKLGHIARIRTWQSIVGYTSAWTAMASGAGLLAIPFIAGANFVGSVIWLTTEGRFLKKIIDQTAPKSESEPVLRWRTEIFPFQWRIALSWASGYLIFQLFNPVIFKYHGAIEAGKVGLALAIFNSMITLSMSWVNAKSPEFARNIGARNHREARALFKHQFTISASVHLMMVVMVLVGYLALRYIGIPIVQRLPDLAVLGWISLASISNQIVFSLAVFMRSHGVEPLLLPSIATGAATLLVISLVGSTSIEWAMALYAMVQLTICLPWVATLFFRNFWLTPHLTAQVAK